MGTCVKVLPPSPWIEVIYCPLDRWLVMLVQRWRIPDIVAAPMIGHHGQYAVLLERGP